VGDASSQFMTLLTAEGAFVLLFGGGANVVL
jgi:hypothetical protein